MSAFTTPGLKLNFSDPRGRMADLLEAIPYEVGRKGSGLLITVPVGFRSDGASVPRLLWSLLPPWGSKTTKAALVHDYALDQIAAGRSLPWVMSVEEADEQFRLALLALGMGWFKAGAIHKLIRLWRTLQR